jgi:hypothetical protein
VTDDIFHAVGCKLVGNGNALLRIRNVITERDRYFLAIDAARIVDFLDRGFRALLDLRAINGVRAGQRCADTQKYISPSRAPERHHLLQEQRLPKAISSLLELPSLYLPRNDVLHRFIFLLITQQYLR